MKEFRTKLASVLAYIYAIGIAVALFAGALSFLGYVAAIIIGGPAATEICAFIYKEIYPVLFYLSSGSILLGLVKMYVAGEKTMVPTKPKKN